MNRTKWIAIVPVICGAAVFADTATPVIGVTNTVNEGSRETKPAEYAGMRLSEDIGKDVYNLDGKQLGTINNIVLDGGVNCVSYAVLSYGGFLGMGDKLFAVPWNSLERRSGEPKRVYINIKDDVLKGAPGFNKDSWPDMADETFRKQINTYYQISVSDRKSDRTDPAAGKTNNVNGTNIAAASTAGPSKQGLLWSRRVSDVIGANVKNTKDEKIGSIKELIVNIHTGEVRYAVLSFGGVMGVGDQLFGIPLSAIQGKSDSKEFVMDISKDQLKAAPGFDNSSWPNWSDSTYLRSIDKHYNAVLGKP